MGKGCDISFEEKDDGNTNCPVILHISDLHFGQKMTASEIRDRKIVFNQFKKTLQYLPCDWKPTCLCITGDISDKNSPEGYDDGIQWIINLMEILSIDRNQIFICPGNHDIDRIVANSMPLLKKEDEIDNMIVIGRLDELEKPFHNFISFMKKLGLHEYYFGNDGNQKSFIFGVLQASQSIQIICFSPYFYDWDKSTEKIVILGNKPLDWLVGEELVEQRPGYERIFITLMHCPRERMASVEIHCYDMHRPATWHRISNMSHLILTGHEHHMPEPFEQSGRLAYTSGIGTIYNGIKHVNSFQLIRINYASRRFEHKPFYWESRSRTWVESCDFRKEWPFISPLSQKSEVITESTEAQPSGERAQSLASELWQCIQKRDYYNAEVLWEREKRWYLKTKSSIHQRWCKQIDQCVIEISLMKD